jgi:hypothetical protein
MFAKVGDKDDAHDRNTDAKIDNYAFMDEYFMDHTVKDVLHVMFNAHNIT